MDFEKMHKAVNFMTNSCLCSAWATWRQSIFDRRLGHAQLVGDLLVQQAFADHGQDPELLRGQAGLPRRNLSPRHRALFGCWPIRILLMWWRCCQIIRQRNLYGNAVHIKLSKLLAQNALPRHGGWHLLVPKAVIIFECRIITGHVSGCIVMACQNAGKWRCGFCMGFLLDDDARNPACGTWLL